MEDPLLEDNLIMYLHIEPELAVNPAGFPFVTQSSALHFLNRILPQDLKVILKDHPSLANNLSNLNFKTVNKQFRQAVIYFLKGKYHNFSYIGVSGKEKKLINSKSVTFTISGDIVLETILAGRRTVCLSDNLFINGKKGIPGIFSSNELQRICINSSKASDLYDQLSYPNEPLLNIFNRYGSKLFLKPLSRRHRDIEKTVPKEIIIRQTQSFVQMALEHLKA